MATQVKHRRGSSAEIAQSTPAIGEFLYDTDKKTIVVGDGVKQGGYPLVSERKLPNLSTINFASTDDMITGTINGVAGDVTHSVGNVYSVGATVYECNTNVTPAPGIGSFTNLTDSEPKNAEQDGRLDALEASDASQGARITTNETDIAALQAGQGSGVFGYATLADINADLTPADGSIGYVTNDPTATNNGTYRKTGGSGTGGWVQSSNDLASQAYAQAIYNSNRVYTAFDALNSVTVSGDATLDDYTKVSIITNGTPNTQTILYNVRFDDVIGVINNAIANGVYDFELIVEMEVTSQVGLTLVKISSAGTTQTPYTVQNNEQEIINLSFSAGEVVSQLYFYTRYSGTAPSDLSTRVKVAQIRSNNDATNARLKQAYDRVIFSDNFYSNKTLINKNKYQVSHFTANETGLTKTYRGTKVDSGTAVLANKFYIGRLLDNIDFLAGEDFTTHIVVRVTGNLTASQVFNGVWTDLGNDLYSTDVNVTSFDPGNSSDIFAFQWNKAITPASDLEVYLVDMYISADGDGIADKIDAAELLTASENTRILCDVSSQGTYGEKYTNLLTAAHSLLDGSETNQYDLVLGGGEFDIATMLDYTDIVDQTPYKRGLELSPWVNMLGEYNTEVNCKFTEAFAVANQDVAQAVSPLNFLGNNKLRNIISYAENCRYAVHDDGNTVNDCIVDTENCHFEHLGNAPTVSWQSTQAYGSGFPSGKVGTFKNTKIISVTDAITIHTSQAQKRPFIARFFGCDLVSKGEGASVGMKETTAYNPKMVNTFELHGCTLGGKITSENKNNPDSFNLVGGGNTVVPVETVDGVRQVNLLGDQGVKKVLTEAASALALLAHSGSGKVRLFTPSDNVKLFAGFAQEAGSTGDLIAVQDGGYIADSDMGITLVVGDTVAIDSGVIVKNGTNTIAICDYDGFAKLI